MKKHGMMLFIILLLVSVLTGCEKQEKNIDLASIDESDIEKIEHHGTTGEKNGDYTYILSDSESDKFIELLSQVELGKAVKDDIAISNGAVSYYTLYYTEGDLLTISPGQYFKIEKTYYDFVNFDELWNEFIKINSIH